MIKTFENFKQEPKVDIQYYSSGQKFEERRELNGQCIYIKYYDNDHKYDETWLLNNKYHREDGPAIQDWYSNGQKNYEVWYINGKQHREDGPAYQEWNENGQKGNEYWYLNHKEYSRDEWVEELKKIGSTHYEEQRMLLDMEKYNL